VKTQGFSPCDQGAAPQKPRKKAKAQQAPSSSKAPKPSLKKKKREKT
jgi:hypothetical protein